MSEQIKGLEEQAHERDFMPIVTQLVVFVIRRK